MFVIEVGTVSKALRRVTHSKSMCEPQETASRRDRTVQGHNLDDSSTFADLGSSPSTLTAGGWAIGASTTLWMPLASVLQRADERKETAAGFWQRADAFFAAASIAVRGC